MKIGFIGAGNVTRTFGRHLINAGHTIVRKFAEHLRQRCGTGSLDLLVNNAGIMALTKPNPELSNRPLGRGIKLQNEVGALPLDVWRTYSESASTHRGR